jgi:hypothetical protein
MNLSTRSKFLSLTALFAVAVASGEDVDLEKAVGSLIGAGKACVKLADGKGFSRGVNLYAFRRSGNLHA